MVASKPKPQKAQTSQLHPVPRPRTPIRPSPDEQPGALFTGHKKSPHHVRADMGFPKEGHKREGNCESKVRTCNLPPMVSRSEHPKPAHNMVNGANALLSTLRQDNDVGVRPWMTSGGLASARTGGSNRALARCLRAGVRQLNACFAGRMNDGPRLRGGTQKPLRSPGSSPGSLRFLVISGGCGSRI